MELSAFTGGSHFTKILEGPRPLATTLIGVRSTKTDHKTTMLNVNSHNSLNQFSTVKGDEVSGVRTWELFHCFVPFFFPYVLFC